MMSLVNKLFANQNKKAAESLDTEPIAVSSKQESSADEKHQINAEWKNNMLTRDCSEILANKLEADLTKSKKSGISFRYYKNDDKDERNANHILLEVTQDSSGEVTLQLGVFREGTDCLYSYYMFEAGETQEAIKSWLLNNEVCVPLILDSAKGLSERVDEYWD